MNFDFLKVITGRRFPIEYIAPPVCEGEFSSTGSPFISLLPIVKESIDTMEVSFQDGVFTFSWDSVPGALCYTVWKETETAEWEIVAECIDPNEWETNEEGCYKVTVISEEGSSSLEDAPKICTTTAFSCPTFSVLLPASVSAAQGVDVTFTVTAATTTPPADLVYTWKKDGTIILTEVLASGTPSSIVKADVTPADDGTYSVEVTVVGKDCAPIVSSCILTVDVPPPPPTCEDDPGPMPTSFLESDDTTIIEFDDDQLRTAYQWTSVDLAPGDYKLVYLGGYVEECVFPEYGATCRSGQLTYHPELCETPCKVHSVRWHVSGFVQVDAGAGYRNVLPPITSAVSNAIDGTACTDCPNPCYNCDNPQVPPEEDWIDESDLADAIAASFPDNTSIGSATVPAETTERVPWNPYVPDGGTYPGRVSATPLWTTVAGAGDNLGNMYWQGATNPYEEQMNFRLVRWRKFTDQPWAPAILNFAGVWAAIKPATVADPGFPTAPCDTWDGSFAGSCYVSNTQVMYDPIGDIAVWAVNCPMGSYHENVEYSSSTIFGDCGFGKWILSITGYWFDGAMWQAENLWVGEKLGGDTALGAYAKTAAFNPGAPNCVVIV